MKLRFNPGRYFKENTHSIDVTIIHNHPQPKSGKVGQEMFAGMAPNTEIELGEGLPKTAAYDVSIDLKGLVHNFPGEKTILIKETYIPYGVSNFHSPLFRKKLQLTRYMVDRKADPLELLIGLKPSNSRIEWNRAYLCPRP